MATPLIEIIEHLPRSRVVLIGDLMVDRYIFGNAERLSPEAPVPVLHYNHEELRLGGAGNVASDLCALGAEVRVVGLVGKDEAANQLRRLLTDCGADTQWFIEEPRRPTISKVRLVGLAQHRHPQQMMRLDYEDPSEADAALADRIIDQIGKALEGAAALCIEDYNKGMLSEEVCQRAIALAKSRRIPVLVDPAAISSYAKYRGATVITPNRTETEKATGLPCDSPEQYAACAERLLTTLDLEAAVLTLDKNGAYLGTRDGQRRWLKTRARRVYDVTGAGDMVLAMLTAARAAGASWSDAVALANVAGGLEVERFGCVPIRPEEIIQELLSEAHQRLGKQRELEPLLRELQLHRSSGKRIVFTNGCFDLIHLGHVQYFRFAKKQGDLLVVAVNTDSSIRRLKGDKRPIINEHDRIGVLEELESIDYLLRFEQDTPFELIQAIRPDVLVKGADYAKEQVVGWDFVESYGGRVALAPLVEGRSTSAVIQRILETGGGT
jgi:D-beta-D-heptose 7-phosphate kinase/D-beta-D-heptose 1-phosphate adenosyltransferase